MPHSRSQEPIDTPLLKVHGRGDVVRQEGKAARRPSGIDATEPVRDARKSSLKMFKEFFANQRTAH